MPDAGIHQKLQLVLKVLVISRAGLAAALGVDKSLVGRWASGAVTPSNHNLANLTRFVADRVPGFTVLDWERDMASFRSLLGVGESEKPATDSSIWVPPAFHEEAQRRAAMRGPLYTGLWRSTRASNDMPGHFVHDITMVWRDEEGRMRVSIGVEGVRYHGWSLILENQIFSVSFDQEAMTAMFSLFNGVARGRPKVLDGINLATLRDAGGSPAASRGILEKTHEITGNREEDEAAFEQAIAELNPLAPAGSIDPNIAEQLTKGVTGEAEGILRVLYSETLSRGATLAEIAGMPKRDA